MTMNKREALLDCAQDLFAREGFHATGIEKILSEAGVAKMTLYNNFGSKDALIAEVLDRASLGLVAQIRAWTAGSSDPCEQIMLLFQGLGAWFDRKECRGCLLQAAAAEFSDSDNPVNQTVLKHTERLQQVMLELTTRSECHEPAELATQLALLVGGALNAVRLCRSRAPADSAARAAAILIEHASRGHPPFHHGSGHSRID